LIYFFIARTKGGENAIVFLVLASLFYYAWWDAKYLVLMLFSIFVNYYIGEAIVRGHNLNNQLKMKMLLFLGLVFNIGLLSYFKYASFFIENFNFVFGSNVPENKIILPLAISFFTFQQIAYLIDSYKGITKEFKFFHYLLFVTFFPQLIAGPIVHHKEMLPQFLRLENLKPNFNNIIIGLSIFTLGLFKKVILADSVAQYATPVFDNSVINDSITFLVAWGGALAYTFQLYFDFSGYSDMAIGIALMFGVTLPLNFNSPYKSLSIIEFWRRWHMTLSRFLRDYIYITLGGNRKGVVRRYGNLLITMLLGGLWHGAGWTFVLWGGFHGILLIINHSWHHFKFLMKLDFLDQSSLWRILCWIITFFAIVNSWVLFRAENFTSALNIYQGMYGLNGVAIPNALLARMGGVSNIISEYGITSYLGGGMDFVFTYLWVLFLLLIIFMPNTQQFMQNFLSYGYSQKGTLLNSGILSDIIIFRYGMLWAFILSILLVFSIFGLTRVSEFLYFQF